tara:strand:+ start:2842 stop:3174 length:333 start_codon:yes stop_codon:yes gene_type:complete
MSRNRKRIIAKNDVYEDDDLFENRGVRSISQYVTPKFPNPTQDIINEIPYEIHFWVPGQRFFKLAQKYYGDHRYWYIIARFNNKPTEAQIEEGEEIRIPTDLQLAVEVLG